MKKMKSITPNFIIPVFAFSFVYQFSDYENFNTQANGRQDPAQNCLTMVKACGHCWSHNKCGDYTYPICELTP